MKVLIAVDGSSGDSVLSDLKRAGLPDRAEAVVLSVADVILPSANAPSGQPAPPWVAEQIERARARATEAVQHAQAIARSAGQAISTGFPDWTVHSEALADSPAWAIVRKAEELKADLIVVGADDRSVIGRLTLGSVSQSVLHNAHTSVRISRGATRTEGAPIRLVAGDDGSADAEAALSALTARAWPHGTTVHLVTAVDEALETLALQSRPGAQATDWIKQLNERFLSRLRDAGLTVSPSVVRGDPRRALLDEADRLQADSIFVGARGLRGIERLLLGSVSTAIATRARCSVEVVRQNLKGSV